MNEATRLAQRILEDQGYLVMSWSDGPDPMPKVGDVLEKPIRGGGSWGYVRGPFKIIGTATATEYIAQRRKVRPVTAEFLDSLSVRLGFFKVVAE